MRAAIVLLAMSLAILSLSPDGAKAQSTTTSDRIFDAVVMRPLGALSVIGGSVLFIPAAIVAVPSGKDGIDEAWEIFVDAQVESTFRRPLGDF